MKEAVVKIYTKEGHDEEEKTVVVKGNGSRDVEIRLRSDPLVVITCAKQSCYIPYLELANLSI